MADFTLSQIRDVPTGGSQAPAQGTPEVSPVPQALDFAGDLFKTFAQGAPARAAQAKAQKETMEQTIAGRFATQQMQIADAVDRGELTSQEARMRMRTNYSQAISDNPAMTDILADAQSTVIGTSGMGKVAAEGTEQEQAFFKVQDSAMADGWITPTMSQSQARENTYAYMQFQRDQQRIEAQKNEIGLQRAQIGLQTDRIQQSTASISNQNARLSLQQNKAQAEARQSLGSMASSYTTRIVNIADNLQEQVDAGELTAEEAVIELDNQRMAVQSSLAGISAQAGGDFANTLTSPMGKIFEVKRARLTGETSAEIANAQTENALAQQNALITADPSTARVLATSKLVGEGGSMVLAGKLNAIAMDTLDKNSDPNRRPGDLTDPSKAQDTQDYLDIINDNLDRSNSGAFLDPDGTGAELGTNITQMLKGMGTYGNMVDNPQDLNQVVGFFSSDRYGQYIDQHGASVPSDAQDAAMDALSANYEEAIKPLLREEWTAANITTSALGTSGVLGTEGTSESATDFIEPSFSGNGVRFVAKAGMGSNARVRRQIENLNKRVGPVLNRLIKAGAHLAGHRNYQQVYESNYAELFGAGESGEGNAE